MKNILTAFVFGILFAGVALAQNPSQVKIAVVEFTPGQSVSAMTPESKRLLQANIAAALDRTRKFIVTDVRWTRAESTADLDGINGKTSTTAAVKLGKKLGVRYVLTGIVVEYTPKGADGFGQMTLKTRLIDVLTGKVKQSFETMQRSTSAMKSTNTAEMQAKVFKPAIESLTEEIVGVDH